MFQVKLKEKSNVPFFPQYAVWLGWISSIVLMFGTLFSAWWFYEPNYKYDALVAALYGALYRITWATGVSWTIIAVSTGNGGDEYCNNNLYALTALGIQRLFKSLRPFFDTGV